MPDGTVVDATHWNYSWGWGAGNMISTLEDMRIWARVLATGKLLSPAMKAAQQQFLTEVFGGGYDSATIRWQFECASSPSYDFSKNVRLE